MIIEIIIISVALAMDAFAVSISIGTTIKKIDISHILSSAGLFGLFQALMPLLGYFLGNNLPRSFDNYSKIIATVLLVIVGGKMIYEAFQEEEDEESITHSLSLKNLLSLAIATSIDAFAVGVTFSLLKTPLWVGVITIGVITFILSTIALFFGNYLSDKIGKNAEIIGGIVLLLLAIKNFIV